MEGFEAVLKTTDRKERKDLVETSLSRIFESVQRRKIFGLQDPATERALSGSGRGIIVFHFQWKGMTFNWMRLL